MSAAPNRAQILFILFMLAAPVSAALAQSTNNVALGHRLAQAHCRQCHVIERGRSGGWTDAPSFPDIADRPATNAAGLIAVMTKPHLKMLYMPQEHPDADALAAYILSLRRR